MILRDEVFYTTDQKVQQDDEFYQIVLDSQAEYSANLPFRVSVYHGRAGDGCQVPETEQFFARRDEAEGGFTRTVSKILGTGFRHYSPAIHGVHDF